MMRFIASTEVFHLVLITEVALPSPIFSSSFSFFVRPWTTIGKIGKIAND